MYLNKHHWNQTCLGKDMLQEITSDSFMQKENLKKGWNVEINGLTVSPGPSSLFHLRWGLLGSLEGWADAEKAPDIPNVPFPTVIMLSPQSVLAFLPSGTPLFSIQQASYMSKTHPNPASGRLSQLVEILRTEYTVLRAVTRHGSL